MPYKQKEKESTFLLFFYVLRRKTSDFSQGRKSKLTYFFQLELRKNWQSVLESWDFVSHREP